MMGHHRPEYQAWIEAAGYAKAKDLLTYEVDIAHWEDPKINRLIAMGEKNPRIRIREIDKSKFGEESRLILNLLNEAWSDNWGYVPLTEAEIAYAGKKLKPIIFNELVRVAEVDGEPVAFMLTIPDINELIKDLNGELFPFNFIKLLWRLRKPRTRRVRVPLMGVSKKLHHSRLASQLAFMMIEFTRRDAVYEIWRDARRVRLDPRGQQGDAVDRRAARRRASITATGFTKSSCSDHPVDGCGKLLL